MRCLGCALMVPGMVVGLAAVALLTDGFSDWGVVLVGVVVGSLVALWRAGRGAGSGDDRLGAGPVGPGVG